MATALIVEDEAVIALDLASELKVLGFDVLGFAKSYTQAMDMVNRALPDVALVDIVLNGRADGAQLAATLRARGVRIVVMSGSERPSEDGGTAFLAKPWNRDDLMRVLAVRPEAAD